MGVFIYLFNYPFDGIYLFCSKENVCYVHIAPGKETQNAVIYIKDYIFVLCVSGA